MSLAGGLSLALFLAASWAQAASAPAETVEVPWACGRPVLTDFFCPPDDALELALQREYWALVGSSDVSGMRAWASQAERYVSGSGSPRAARLETMLTAGLVLVYRSYALDDPRGLPLLLEALRRASHAHALEPDSPNVGCFYYFLRAYADFGLGRWDSGMEKVEELLSFPSRFGALGSEGEVVGALALGLLTERPQVERSLEILDECRTFNCQRTSSLAPFKVVGMHMAIAEERAKIGDLIGMKASLAEARQAGTQLGWPYMERIDALEQELTRPGGLIESWNTSAETLGYVRLPLPPSARVESCSGCHVGAEIPPEYLPSAGAPR